MKRLLLLPSVSINAIPLYFLDLKKSKDIIFQKYYAAVLTLIIGRNVIWAPNQNIRMIFWSRKILNI